VVDAQRSPLRFRASASPDRARRRRMRFARIERHTLVVTPVMRRLPGPVATAVLVLVLAACGAPDLTAPKEKDLPVDTPEMVALKQAAGLEDCPAAQVASGAGALPKLTLPCLGGGSDVDLSTLSGPLVINVWSSQCEPCRKEMPALGEFHRRYGDQVPLLGIDIADTTPVIALKQAKRRKATYPQLFDLDAAIQETKALHISGQPTFFFLHADGTVTRQAGGLESLAEVVAMVNEQLDLDLA
ncbi:MAG: TlpA disulfide reductase family protein, partial [Nocardioides sp.]|uniref:TlpA family protein disulfide reductase n=1 Tax=Nocardioides sp. TaxID=35761 RepID=UPI0039E29A56